MRYRMILVMTAVMAAALFGGCKDSKVIEHEEDKYKLVAVDDSELEDGCYYVKDKTKFYKTHAMEGYELADSEAGVSSLRVGWYGLDETLIPTLYKDEVIAYASISSELDAVTLDRLSFVGASLAFYGGSADNDGYFKIDPAKIVEESSAAAAVEAAGSEDIRVVSIDGEKIEKYGFSSSGIIKGLEKDKEYKVDMFAGTRYMTAKIIADRYFLQSFEVYTIDKAIMTKNGYLSLSMPDGAKSGFYSIDGNVFKYLAFEKGKGDENEAYNNMAFYDTEEKQLAAYAQQYAINIKTTTTDVTFTVEYDDTEYDQESIRCILLSPDETTYDMQTEPGKASITLTEAIAGQWVMNITPKDMEILDVTAASSTAVKDAKPNKYEFIIDEPVTNQQFFAYFTGDGDIWGVVEAEDGTATDMEIIKEYEMDNEEDPDGLIAATIPYLPAGTYTMTVYHYENVAVKDYGYREDTENIQEEIITIEE